MRRALLALLLGPYEVQGALGQGLDVGVGPWLDSQALQEPHHPLLLEHGAVVRGFGGDAERWRDMDRRNQYETVLLLFL